MDGCPSSPAAGETLKTISRNHTENIVAPTTSEHGSLCVLKVENAAAKVRLMNTEELTLSMRHVTRTLEEVQKFPHIFNGEEKLSKGTKSMNPSTYLSKYGDKFIQSSDLSRRYNVASFVQGGYPLCEEMIFQFPVIHWTRQCG